jgi:hypothetical protein
MLIDKPASFIQTFVEDLNDCLKELEPTAKLTRIQRTWLGFCLMGILLVNSVCWAKFERASLGGYKIAALSWMLRQSKIAWSLRLLTSVKLVLKQYRITEGVASLMNQTVPVVNGHVVYTKLISLKIK